MDDEVLVSLENFWQLPQDFLAFNSSRECVRIFKVYFWSVLLKVFLFQKVLKICDNFYKFSFNGSRSGNSASLSAPAASVRTKSNLNWWRKSFCWKWKIIQVSYAQPFCSLTGCFDKLFLLQSKGGHTPSYDNCYICLLAPTGALIVTVVYYIYIDPRRPLFEISSISANIFSFSFCKLNTDW